MPSSRDRFFGSCKQVKRRDKTNVVHKIMMFWIEISNMSPEIQGYRVIYFKFLAEIQPVEK